MAISSPSPSAGETVGRTIDSDITVTSNAKEMWTAVGRATPDTSPTVTDWISAIGTVGALGVAVIILAFDIYRRWAMWRRGQAQEVTAWLARPEKESIPQRESSLYVANPSGDLIYEVQGVYGSRNIGTLGGAVPPGQIAEFGTDIMLIWRVHPCGVRFVDARGLGWERTSSGRLRRHRDADTTGLWAWRKQHELRARERDYERYKRDLIAKHAADEAAVAGDGVSSGNNHA